MQLDLVTIVVRDYDEAIDFFVGVLGIELVQDAASLSTDGRAKRWVVVRPIAAQTGILLAVADGEAQERALGQQTGSRVGFFLRVDDFDVALARMRAAGVEFEGDPRREDYGQVVVFRDLYGNRWDLLGP